MANERRLIDRKAAVDTLTRIALQVSDSKTRTVARCISAVELLPTVDAVIPVRCKDCKHYDGHICEFHSEWPDQYNTGHTAYMEPDDFCSYGEAKSGTQPQREGA